MHQQIKSRSKFTVLEHFPSRKAVLLTFLLMLCISLLPMLAHADCPDGTGSCTTEAECSDKLSTLGGEGTWPQNSPGMDCICWRQSCIWYPCNPVVCGCCSYDYSAPSTCATSGDSSCGDTCNGSPECTDSCGEVGEPIALVSGNETFVRTDLTVGKLYPITIERRYNSLSGYDSPLGYAWAYNYDKRLYAYPNTQTAKYEYRPGSEPSISIRQECGWKKRYRWYSAAGTYLATTPGSYPFMQLVLMGWSTCAINPITGILECTVTPSDYMRAPMDNSSFLTENVDGTFTVTNKFGEKEQYDTYGRLASRTAANGNSLAFTYEAVTRDPLWGLLPANIIQTSSLIVAYDYRLSKIEEKNAAGNLTGAWVSFHYQTGTGRITDIVDSAGRTVSYTHDTFGNLTGVSGPNGSAIYRYENTTNKHWLTSIDENSGEYVNTYDTTGRVTKQTHGAGEIDIAYPTPYSSATATTFTKDSSSTILNTQQRDVTFGSLGRLSSMTDAFGNVTKYSRENHGWLTKEERFDSVNTLLSRTTYVYDTTIFAISTSDFSNPSYDRDLGLEKGNMLSKTEASGLTGEKTTTYTYHPVFGLVTTETVSSVVNPAQTKVITNTYDDTTGSLLTTNETGLLGNGTAYSYTTTYGYDANGKLISIDGPRTDVNDVSTFAYDTTTGYITSITQPVIGTTSFSNHDSLGNPQTVTDPNNNITTYTYDTVGRVTSVKAPGDTNAAQYFYATAGCLSCGDELKLDHVILPEGNRIDFGYDTYGNMNLIKDGQNNTINYTFDSEGNKLTEQIKDSGGNLQKSLSYKYDALNRLAKVINPDSTYTQSTYDGLGNRKTAKDPKGNTTTYGYDALMRLSTVFSAGTATTSFGYATNDNLSTVTDANGNATTYIIDDHGNVYQAISPDTGTTTYQYNPARNMVSKTDAKGVTIGYQYDAANRLTKIDFPTDTDIIYAYDTCVNGKGRLCSMTDASGTTSYEYTAKGQIKKETKTISSVQYVTQYTYDQNGNLMTMAYPSGRVITYNYSNDHAVSVLNNAVTLATNVNYKPFGGLSSITYGNGIGGTIAYDDQYRITSIAAGSIMNLSYDQYDANANIQHITNTLDPTKNKTFGYDALDRLTSGTGSWGSLGWTYDGVGNRLTENSNSYTYFSNTNKLSSANGKSYGYDSNGNTTGEGLRTFGFNDNQRLISVSDAGASYTYNGYGQRVKKVVNGVTTVFHYSLSGQIIAESNSAGNISAEYVYLNGQPLAKIAGTNTYYYHNDHLGTPQKMTDSTGTVVWSADYKPFGEATIIISTITNNLRLPGQYYDAETGLFYNYFRDYNPAIGGYIEADPIGLFGGINPYRYVNNSPILRMDPRGLQGNLNLGNGYTARVDQFNSIGGNASHEIHVYNNINEEVGVFGPGGWINKHGFTGAPENFPQDVFNSLNGVNVDLLRKEGSLPAKGTCNIKGGRYMNGLGILSTLLMIPSVLDAERRANEHGVNVWDQMILDFYDAAGYTIIYQKDLTI
jgi:RHS repeat-associated protein